LLSNSFFFAFTGHSGCFVLTWDGFHAVGLTFHAAEVQKFPECASAFGACDPQPQLVASFSLLAAAFHCRLCSSFIVWRILARA